jgi:hypothetical protein
MEDSDSSSSEEDEEEETYTAVQVDNLPQPLLCKTVTVTV